VKSKTIKSMGGETSTQQQNAPRRKLKRLTVKGKARQKMRTGCSCKFKQSPATFSKGLQKKYDGGKKKNSIHRDSSGLSLLGYYKRSKSLRKRVFLQDREDLTYSRKKGALLAINTSREKTRKRRLRTTAKRNKRSLYQENDAKKLSEIGKS